MASMIEKSRFPKWVYDDSGEIIEVILGYDDFKTLPIGRRSLSTCRMRLMPY
jgi:hypothetical protein